MATLATVGPLQAQTAVAAPSTFWNSATVYFLLTDRFENGNPGNDHALRRAHDGALLRNFEGGDLAGLRRRIDQGYFDSLGVTVIWLTPFVEQIHGGVDEGTGKTYGYHGYWTRDWTAVDPALGTKSDLRAMVDAAHRHRHPRSHGRRHQSHRAGDATGSRVAGRLGPHRAQLHVPKLRHHRGLQPGGDTP